jgi:hypothetical protein
MGYMVTWEPSRKGEPQIAQITQKRKITKRTHRPNVVKKRQAADGCGVTTMMKIAKRTHAPRRASFEFKVSSSKFGHAWCESSGLCVFAPLREIIRNNSDHVGCSEITKRTQLSGDRRFQDLRSQIVRERRSQTAATALYQTNPFPIRVLGVYLWFTPGFAKRTRRVEREKG